MSSSKINKILMSMLKIVLAPHFQQNSLYGFVINLVYLKINRSFLIRINLIKKDLFYGYYKGTITTDLDNKKNGAECFLLSKRYLF